MAITPTYPGIYIQELPSSTHTITAAPTSVTVFVGYTHPFKTDPANWLKAVEIFSFTDYEREFGGLYTSGVIESHVAYTVNQFFLNGGAVAYVVGLQPNYYDSGGTNHGVVLPATLTLGSITFTALEPIDQIPMLVTINNLQTPAGSPPTADISITYGSRGETYRKVTVVPGDANFIETRINGISQLVTVAPNYNPPFIAGTNVPLSFGKAVAVGSVAFTAITSTSATPMTVTVTPTGSPLGSKATIVVTQGATTETYNNVNMTTGDPRFIEKLINGVSALVTVAPTYQTPTVPVNQAALGYSNSTNPPQAGWTAFSAGDFAPVFQADSSLDKVSVFNLLVLPGVADNSVWSEALAFCERKLAFLILDPPVQDSADGDGPLNLPLIGDDIQGSIVPKSTNGALYFPYLQSDDPLTGNVIELPPSGFVAGIYARTDVNRGVWKAPAGLETTVVNTTGVVERGRMTDMRQGTLNPLGVNCLRDFPGIGTVVFGARTLVTNNPAFEQWRYVPVRRMALFLEQTLYQNLGWVVFEPNDEPLWVAITASINSFMLSLFHQGAFQGDTPSQAFQVKCDSSTTTQTDIDNGIVNIIVAFAPLKPAEFVIIKIAQLAGQTQA
jgi:phage tail sheath protein FI